MSQGQGATPGTCPACGAPVQRGELPFMGRTLDTLLDVGTARLHLCPVSRGAQEAASCTTADRSRPIMDQETARTLDGQLRAFLAAQGQGWSEARRRVLAADLVRMAVVVAGPSLLPQVANAILPDPPESPPPIPVPPHAVAQPPSDVRR